MIRILVAGLVGGIVAFVWGFISHMVIQLGEMGVEPVPQEEAVIRVLDELVAEPGLYYFPGQPDMTGMDAAERATVEEEWMAKFRKGPRGIVIYRRSGAEPMGAGTLGVQFACDVLASLLAAYLLTHAVGSMKGFASRFCFVAMLGVFAALAINVPYWNWYGFPDDFTVGQVADVVIKWGLVGIVIGLIVKAPKS